MSVMSTADLDPDSPIHVSVVPSQSSYFAGEPFSVSITFTNTRSSSSTTKRVGSTHKRGAHSVSSAPLARPPTSPVTPKTALAPSVSGTRKGNKAERRGLIGKRSTDNDVSNESKVRPGLVRSMSTSTVAPLGDATILGPIAGHPSGSRVLQCPSFTRSPSLPISSNHPHARKQSVLDGQVQLRDMPTTTPSPSPFPPSASASTFSLSLDPINEAAPSAFTPSPSPHPNGKEHTFPPPTPTSHSYPPVSPTPQKRSSHHGLGHGRPPPLLPSVANGITPSRSTASPSFTQPNSEVILYAYARLGGTLVLTTPPGAKPTPAQTQATNDLRRSLVQRSAVGGGSMDISASVQAGTYVGTGSLRGRRTNSHGRSSSLSSSILSLLSPSTSLNGLSMPPTPSTSGNLQQWSPGHKARSPSLLSSLFPSSTSSPATIGANETGEEEPDPEIPLPTLEVPPSMIAVDLVLGPGESRTYTYSIPLPENLPPTFKGRAVKFAYHFVLGICRAGASSPQPRSSASPNGVPLTPKSTSTSTSRVMRVPVRVYSNVAIEGDQKVYDLMSPIRKAQQGLLAKVVEESVLPGKGKCTPLDPHSLVAPWTRTSPVDSLREYGHRLLSAFPDPDSTGVRIKLPVEAVTPERERESGELTGCREAVEILTRNMKRVSFDVNKDGVKVAVLTFVKSAYRLGETVLGVVELNDRPNRARVLKVSAMLEAHESLPHPLSGSAPGGKQSLAHHLRKVHAEHHSSLVSSTQRTTFALDIPSDSSPAFQCSVGNDKSGSGGLEWKVRLCLLVAVASPSAREGVGGLKIKHMVQDGSRGEWGSAWKATDSIAPLERVQVDAPKPQLPRLGSGSGDNTTLPPYTVPRGARGWASYFISNILLPGGEREYHDGDEDDDYAGADSARNEDDMNEFAEVDFGWGEGGWRDIMVETVECEVPIRVWPGNTAFRPLEVVFDV